MRSMMRRCLHLACLAVLALPAAAGAQTTPPASSSPPAGDQQEQRKRQADDAYRNRDFEGTIALTSQVLQETPGDPLALYLRASARVEQGIARRDRDLIRAGIEDARSAIRQDASKKPDYYLPYLYGMSHLTLLEQNRAHAETAVATATQILQRGNVEQSIRANLLYQRGVARVQLQQHGAAADDFRQALDLDTTHLAARMALSNALVAAGEFQAAQQSFDAAIATFPTSAVVFNNRGTFHQSQRRNDQAIRDFTQAIALDEEYLQAYLNRGFTHVQSGEAAAAIEDFNAVLDREPDNTSALSLRGTARLRSGDFEQAIADYTRAVEVNPADPTARADLGFAYFFSGDYETAAAAFDQSLTLKPDNEFLKPWRYTALMRSGQEALARSSYAALTGRPVDQQSWFDALTLHLMGNLSVEQLIGRVESRDARLKDAQICEAYYFIGVRKQTSDPEEAAAYFRRAVRSQAKQLSAYQAAQLALEQEAPNR
jgi:tetratricopeptide (TPR) repeat protein